MKEPLTEESGAGGTQEIDVASQALLGKLQRKKKIMGNVEISKGDDRVVKGGDRAVKRDDKGGGRAVKRDDRAVKRDERAVKGGEEWLLEYFRAVHYCLSIR